MTTGTLRGTLTIFGGVIASTFFLLLPGSSDFLYAQGSPVVGVTRVTANEWLWMVVVTPVSVILTMNSNPKPTDAKRVSMFTTKSRACQAFVFVNMLWMAAAMGPPILALSKEEFFSSQALWWKVVELIGAKAAWPAMWNLAIVVFPVCRTASLLTSLGGLSPREALPLHYWASYALVTWLTIHALVLSLVYYIDNAGMSISGWFALMLPFRDQYTEGVVNFMGWVGWFSFFALWLLSQPSIRNRFFNTFYLMHFLFAFMAIFFSHLHDYNVLFFVQPAFVAWVIDLFRRKQFTQTLVGTQKEGQPLSLHNQSNLQDVQTHPNSVCMAGTSALRVKWLPDVAMVALTIPIPSTWTDKLTANMFIYLNCPTISKWEFHPFSIGMIDNSCQNMTIYVKALGDWTTIFVHKIQSLCEMNVEQMRDDSFEDEESCKANDTHGNLVTNKNVESINLLCDNSLLILKVEGPYGGSSLEETLKRYNHCVFLAGGIGLTGLMSLVETCQLRGQECTLLWLVKSAGEVSFFEEFVDRVPNRWPQRLANFQIYLTESGLSQTQEDPEVDLSGFRSKSFNFLSKTSPTTRNLSNRGWGTTTAALLGTILSLLLGRLLCNNEQLRVDAERVMQCSVWTSSSLCVVCERDDPVPRLDTEFPCCKAAVCYYCFRGAPILLTCILVPVCVYIWSRVSTGVTRLIRLCASKWSFAPNNREDRRDTEYHFDSILSQEISRLEDEGKNQSLLPCSFVLRRGRVHIPDLLSSITADSDNPRIGDSSSGDNANDKIALVVCGPESLRRAATEYSKSNHGQLRVFQVD